MFRPGLAVSPAELIPLDRPGARRVRVGQEVFRDELAAIDRAEGVYDPGVSRAASSMASRKRSRTASAPVIITEAERPAPG